MLTHPRPPPPCLLLHYDLLSAELLKDNLYEFQKFLSDAGEPPYFTLPRVQRIARQVLESLEFLQSIGLVHSDLKPENILIKSYSKCEVKVRDPHQVLHHARGEGTQESGDIIKLILLL